MLYDIILLVHSISFSLCYMTNPNPKFYKYKNTKINRKENKNKRENKKKLSPYFLFLTSTVYFNLAEQMLS